MRLILDDVMGALHGGTFDSRDDRHISWTPSVVDKQGWEESVDLVNETLEQIIKIHAGSAKRLAKSGEEGIPASVVLMNYEGLSAEAKKSSTAKAKKSKKASRKA